MKHPATYLVDALHGDDRAFLAWTGVLLGAIWLAPSESNLRLGLLLLLLVGWFLGGHRGSREEEKASEIHDLQAKYADGEISLEEFEEEAEVVLDPRARRIREALEDVDDVGPVTATNIARSARRRGKRLSDVASAEPEKLESVNGVGPNRAESIAEQLGRAR